MVFPFQDPFPEFKEDDSEAEAKHQSKHIVDKASGRNKKSNEAAAGKDGHGRQKFPSSQRNGGGNQTEMSSSRITDVKNRNAEKPSKQPASRKSDVEEQKTRKHDVPSPRINRSDESTTGGKKPEKKSYSSPDSRNFMEVKDTLELRIRLHCNCEGCIDRVRETVLKFKGVQRVAVKADKDMVKVIGSVERKELASYLEKKLRWNLAYLPIKDYNNVVDDHTEDEADGGPVTDCSPRTSTTVQPTCQYSGEDDGKMQPFESSSPGDAQKVARTVVLKIRQYCQEGCPQQTQESLKGFPGVKSFKIDADQSQVEVIGTMKVKKLVSHLQKKMNREVVLVSEERIKNVTDELNIVAEASGGCGIEAEKVAKVVEELPQVKNVPDGRDTKVSAAMKASNKSKAMSRVHVDKVVKVGAKGMHKEKNVSGGGEVRSQKASKKSKADSRVHPVNLDGQTRMNPDLPRSKTRSGINGDTMHHLENSMERKNDITSDGNKVLTKISGVNYGQLKGDVDVVQWAQKLKNDAVGCDGDIYKHRGADEVKKKVKEVVAAVGNMNGAWRKDELGGAYTDINTPYQQNYGVDSQFQWMSPSFRYVSPFSDEVVSCDEQDVYFW